MRKCEISVYTITAIIPEIVLILLDKQSVFEQVFIKRDSIPKHVLLFLNIFEVRGISVNPRIFISHLQVLICAN